MPSCRAASILAWPAISPPSRRWKCWRLRSPRSGHPCGSWHFLHTGSADRSPTARPCRPATVFDFRSRLARGRAHAGGRGSVGGRRRVRASARPIRLLIAPRAQVVAELPGLGIRALSTAAFKLAELVALAQFIAGAECKDRAHAYAKFAEGELRVSRQ